MNKRYVKIGLIAVLGMIGTFAGSSSLRAEDCHCERYRPLVGFSSLGASVYSVGTAAIADSRSNMDSDRQKRLIDHLGAQAYELIPAECREQLLGSDAHLSLFAKGILDNSHAKYVSSQTAPQELLHSYAELARRVNPAECGNWAVNSTNWNGCMVRASQQSYAEMRQKISGKTAQEVLLMMQNKLPAALTQGLTVANVKVLQAFDEFVNAPSDKVMDLLPGIASRHNLNTAQKILLIQMAGADMSADYDKNLETNWSASQGNGPGVAKIHSAMKDNLAISFAGQKIGWQVRDGDVDYEGVCRHIASFQGLMAEKLGFRNVYVISETLQSGEMHVTFIMRDPEFDTVYRGDYGSIRKTTGGDSMALAEGTHDISLNMRVFHPDGRMVGDIKTAFGQFMDTASDMLDIDPMVHPKGAIVGANIDLGLGATQARVFVGNDGAGTTYFGAAGNKYWGQNGSTPGGIAVVIATGSRDGSIISAGAPGAHGLPSTPTGTSYNLDTIYVKFQQQFPLSPTGHFGPNVEAKIEGMASAMFALSRTRSNDGFDGKLAAQGDLALTAQARVDQKAWGDRIRATYLAGAEVVPGLNNVQNVSLHQAPIPVLNKLFMSAEGRMKLSQSPEGRAYLIAATTVLIDQLGARGRAQLGIFGDKVGATIQVEGRLTNDSVLFEDGSARTVGASAFWTPNKVVKLSVTASLPLETAVGNGISVMAGLKVTR